MGEGVLGASTRSARGGAGGGLGAVYSRRAAAVRWTVIGSRRAAAVRWTVIGSRRAAAVRWTECL